MKNTQIVLKEIPQGVLREDHFETVVSDRPAAGDGQVLLRNLILSQDAANRAWMQGATYRQAVKPGDVMHCGTLAEVVESNSDRFVAGDLVFGEGGWQDYFVADPKTLKRVPDLQPRSHLISLLGIAGLTAYHGLIHVGKPNEGETVVVSAAAGSVGTFVGQIAKIVGCRVVGIAGGAEKCQWLIDELGFDAAVDYKAGGVGRQLAEACLDGIDVYFDNVGGSILEAALFNMNMKGRVVCCGAVSQYDTDQPESPRGLPGLVVVKRLRMEGFIVLDFRGEQAKEAQTNLALWAGQGKLKVIEDIIDGLENAPRGLIGLLNGENRGKRMIRLG